MNCKDTHTLIFIDREKHFEYVIIYIFFINQDIVIGLQMVNDYNNLSY